MKKIIFFQLLLFSTFCFARSSYLELGIDPLFTMTEELNSPAENSLNSYGMTYGAKFGMIAHEDNISYEAHFLNSSVEYIYDETLVDSKINIYGLGTYYFFNKDLRAGLLIDRFDQDKTVRGNSLDGFLVSLGATHNYQIYQEYYLNLSVIYSLFSFAESDTKQSLKYRSVLIGAGRTF